MSGKKIALPPLALLAGGAGKRLGSLTRELPKPMVRVAGEPFIAHQLRLLKRKGIARVVILAGYLGEKIRDFVGDGSRFGLQVEYVFDGPKLLGTGGAVQKALPLLGGVFWVMYGDSYLDTDFSLIWKHFLSQKKAALMTVFFNEDRWDKSNVLFSRGVIQEYNKKINFPGMKHIDYGLGILTRRVFKGWEDKKAFDLADVYARIIQRGEMLGFEVDKRFYEIGSAEGLKQTESYLVS